MASVTYLVKSSLHLLVALALVWSCIHVLFSNVGQYVTPDDLMLPDRMNKKGKEQGPHPVYRSKEEWLSWIMESDSLVQRKLEFIRSNLLRLPQQDSAENQQGYVSLHFNSCTLNQPSNHLAQNVPGSVEIAAGLKALYESTEQVTVLVLRVQDMVKLSVYIKAGNSPPLYTILLLDPSNSSLQLDLHDLPYLPPNLLYLQSEVDLLQFHNLPQPALGQYCRAMLVASVLCSEVLTPPLVYCRELDQAGCVKEEDRLIVKQLLSNSSVVIRTVE